MLRDITLRMDLTDEELETIIPSGSVWVEIIPGGRYVSSGVVGRGEVLYVKDHIEDLEDNKT